MRYLWCVNQAPDYVKGDKAGINGYFFGAWDAVTTQALLSGVRNRAKAVGIYVAWNWPQLAGKTPEQIAEIVSKRYADLYVPGLKVQFDVESHTPDTIVAILTAWRKLRPHVGTSLTVEGMQGGWLRAIAPQLIDLGIRVVPQAYWGADGKMEGDWAADQVLRDLIVPGKAGAPAFPEALVSLFYDADHLPRDWDGYAFEQNRLPA